MEKRSIAPVSGIGKWSVGLQGFFLLAVIVSLFLVNAFGFSFDDHWWDVSVPFIFGAGIAALATGVIATRKGDRSVSVLISVALGIGTVLFLLLHSLFIAD